jgi:hypothetical protein
VADQQLVVVREWCQRHRGRFDVLDLQGRIGTLTSGEQGVAT